MKISLDLPGAEVYIKHFAPRQLTLNTGVYSDPQIITPHSTEPWTGVTTLETLTPDALRHLLNRPSDVILIGSGDTQSWLPPTLLALMADSGKSIDIMPSKAACRTFNLLAAEGREVVLGLLV
jgi:uncharacterized protein